jgi:hypothetical protein
MIERWDPSSSSAPTLETAAQGHTRATALGRALALSLLSLLGCGSQSDDTPGQGGSTMTGGAGATGAAAGIGGAGAGGSAAGGAGAGGSVTGGAGASGSATGGAGSGSGGIAATGGLGGAPAGAGGMSAGLGGLGGAGAGGLGGQAAGGMAGAPSPAKLSETGLFTARGTAPGELVLAEGVRAFEPKYKLWSDGADKKRYVYLPPGAKIDTTDADHWVLPPGTKLWKSFIMGERLVETRLIEFTPAGGNAVRYATYYWTMADSTDADLVPYEEQYRNAGMTTHDIPNGPTCERCHNTLKDHALGFGAFQLNHSTPGSVTLQQLLDEELLTVPIPTTNGLAGEPQLTQDALGYLHANCGNCHNDSPGIPVENVPEPQMFLRLSVADQSLEQTDTWLTAINRATTASADLGLDYRILGGGALEESAIYHRMGLRMSEGDQMPPIGSEIVDMEGRELIGTWIDSLPSP